MILALIVVGGGQCYHSTHRSLAAQLCIAMRLAVSTPWECGGCHQWCQGDQAGSNVCAYVAPSLPLPPISREDMCKHAYIFWLCASTIAGFLPALSAEQYMQVGHARGLILRQRVAQGLDAHLVLIVPGKGLYSSDCLTGNLLARQRLPSCCTSRRQQDLPPWYDTGCH